MAGGTKTFGTLVRETRLDKGYSLRKFAELVGVSPTYLSQVEQGKVEKPPTAERVRRMAELLDANTDEWIALAGRMAEDLADFISQRPAELPEMLREASGLTAEQIKQLTEQIRRLKEQGEE